jgi:MFS family permease
VLHEGEASQAEQPLEIPAKLSLTTKVDRIGGLGHQSAAELRLGSGMGIPYADVLRVRHVRPLLLATMLVLLSAAMGPLALILVVQRATGSFARAGLASAATALLSGVSAPLRGRLVDRYGQRRCLLPFALTYAAALAGVVLVARPGVPAAVASVALAGLAGASVPPVAASMRVVWAALVGDRAALQSAFALDAFLEEVVYTVGPLAAGALAVIRGPDAALLAAAGAGLLGTAAFAASPASRSFGGRPATPAGWAGALARPGVRTLMGSLAGVGAALGIWDIGLVAAARGEGSGALGGVLLALLSGGSALGGLLYGARHWRAPAARRYLWLLALLLVACAPLALAPGLLALGGVVVLVGLLLAPVASSAYVLAIELAPAGTLTEAAGWVTTAQNVTAAGGIALAGFLVERVGVPRTFWVACGCVAVAVLVAAGGRAGLAGPAVAAAETEPDGGSG